MARVARPVAIALGSNLGDRRAHLEFAIHHLQALLPLLRVSAVVETAPVDTPDPQQPYLNAVAVAESDWPAARLLASLQAIEAARGRARPYRNAPRTIDLDLILAGADVIDTSGLVVPHPRFRERRFVLAPLAEIAPGLVDPVTSLRVAELLARCPR